jgi:pimeloyl-ACP methyl ester carboxylesterase
MRRKACLSCGVIVLLLALAALVGPFLVPIPPLQGTVPPEELAGPDSRFAVVDGLRMHYQQAGRGEPTLVLLHGFVASTFSWREVLTPLAGRAAVIAFDRPAAGLTQRPLPGDWEGESPYSPEAQADQTVGLLDTLGVETAVLVGHSAGGTIAMLTALRHPDRVAALVLVDPAIYTGGTPGWVRPFLRLPQVRRLGPLLVRSIQRWGERLGRTAWHDPSKLTPEVWEGYQTPLRAQHWDVGLWQLTEASHPLHLERRLHEVRVPVLVVTGDDDRIVPTPESVRLAGELPDAELVVIPRCGHVPHEECPEAFLDAVTRFLARIP